jgi:hypothetical protein
MTTTPARLCAHADANGDASKLTRTGAEYPICDRCGWHGAGIEHVAGRPLCVTCRDDEVTAGVTPPRYIASRRLR